MEDERSVLSLGLGLCLEQDIDKFNFIKNLHLFVRNLSMMFRTINHPPPVDPLGGDRWTRQEFRALRELTLLAQESEDLDVLEGAASNLIDEIDLEGVLSWVGPGPCDLSNLKNKSSTFPTAAVNTNLKLFLHKVSHDLENLTIQKQTEFHILAAQQLALVNLQSYGHLVIKLSDKGFNLVVMDSVERTPGNPIRK